MARQKILRTNFASGELAPEINGRFELPIYKAGLSRCENFIPMVEGPAKFRPGTRYVFHTRRHNKAFLGRFQYNDEQAYILEFTEGWLRFYANEGILTETAQNITAATQTNPVVVTIASHGYTDGDEVFIEGIAGMTELNGRGFVIANSTANTFELQDSFGNNIDGTGFSAYSSAGTAAKVVEVQTPWQEEDLFQINYAQDANTMYLTHPEWEPRKLTRTSATAFSLALFDRTADPFTDKKTITGITQADPAVVTSASHGLTDGTEIIIEEVVGMTEVNGNKYLVSNATANTFELQDLSGNDIDSTGFTAYSSGGYATKTDEFPVACTFHEASLFYGGTPNRPQHVFKSQGVNPSDGSTRYDDFTLGTDADDGTIYAIASREINLIRTMTSAETMIFVGTYGGVMRVRGSDLDDPITPTSINARQFSNAGCANQIAVDGENLLFYVEDTLRRIRSVELNEITSRLESVDRNVVSYNITSGNIVQIAYFSGRENILWAVKGDGNLIGLTIKTREDVSGWHRHKTGDSSDLFESIQSLPRSGTIDQLWTVVQRSVNGNTVRYVEFFEDEPEHPDFRDYFTGAANESTDEQTFWRAMFETQKTYLHVDSALSYDGTTPGSDAGATMTPGATTGTGVTFTASAAVFASTDVGRQIWKKSADGTVYGRAEITAFNSSTSVDCTILVDFDSTDAIAAGSWFLTTDTVTGLWHLEGKTLKLIVDGGTHDDVVVSDGSITLDYQVSTVHAGIGFEGFIETMNLEGLDGLGPAQDALVNINEVGIKFLNTLGAKYGSSLYNLQTILFRSSRHPTDRPPPLLTGTRQVQYSDTWKRDKTVIIKQESPLPCIVQQLIIHADTGD